MVGYGGYGPKARTLRGTVTLVIARLGRLVTCMYVYVQSELWASHEMLTVTIIYRHYDKSSKLFVHNQHITSEYRYIMFKYYKITAVKYISVLGSSSALMVNGIGV